MSVPFQTMGIVNITPDSFSDGGNYNHFKKCHKHMGNLVSQGVQYLDIGAESTAPFNDSITEEEEKKRYKDIFFPAIVSFPTLSALSIDTYRPETFLWVFKHLREKGFSGNIIWNDVSGVLDEKTLETLEYSKASYIYTYNRVERREDVGDHLKFVGEKNVFEEVRDYFKRGIEKLSLVLPRQKIWLDPGFGFSKNIEQNWDLLKHVPTLLGQFMEHTFLLGVSRKRFLQSMVAVGSAEEKRRKSEYFHLLLCAEWMRTVPLERFVVRLHDPEIALSAMNYAMKMK